ncbi:MAG: ATP-binding protein [Actinobacteria bacterium]|nr:ATP-binding protein [Actinomycetota bacterium]MCL6104424.1 ATP-binding protein [Actinomycetota bacterium]
MNIPRYLSISDELKKSKTLVLLGPRRVGKTTLLNNFITSTKEKTAVYRGDELSTQHAFESADSNLLKGHIGTAKILAIDEAQAIKGIGQSLKIINDTMPEVSVIVTGSSSFELTGQVGEPLTGRKTTRYLFPIALTEVLANESVPMRLFQQNLPSYLVYGMYPDIITAENDQARIDFLRELVDLYLLRDILTYQAVKGSRVILQLLVLLAYQVGNKVSHQELGSSLNIDKNTVARYLDLLEKSYIIFRLSGFSRNLRSEVTKTAKYFFYDVGIRNAVINNFNPLEIREDGEKLWENFIIVERLKMRTYTKLYANQYFWRTWKQSEVDLVEEREGKLFGYEFKWKEKVITPPKEWNETYGDEAAWTAIYPNSALKFLGIE